MFKILRDCLAIVGVSFIVVIYYNPGLIPPSVATAKIYYSRSITLIQLIVEEWGK